MTVTEGGHATGGYAANAPVPVGLQNGDIWVIKGGGFYDKDATFSASGFTPIIYQPGNATDDREFCGMIGKVITNAAGEVPVAVSVTGGGGDFIPMSHYVRGADTTSIAAAVADAKGATSSNTGVSSLQPAACTVGRAGSRASIVGCGWDFDSFGSGPLTITDYTGNVGGSTEVAGWLGTTDLSVGTTQPTVPVDNNTACVAVVVFQPAAGGGGGGDAPLLPRRLAEDVAFDVRQPRTRALPVAPVPNIAPLRSERRREEVPVVEFAQRARMPRFAPQLSLIALIRRAEEELAPEEYELRPKPVPLALQADVAPRRNRRSSEQVAPDESVKRTRPRVAPSVDFAPLSARRAEEESVPDEAAPRFRPPPAQPVAPGAPLIQRRAVGAEAPVDEDAQRSRAVPLPLQADLAPLRTRGRLEQGSPEETQRRVPFVAPPPVVAAQPSLPRRLLEWLGFEEWPRPRRAVPLAPTADIAPLRRRGVPQDEPAIEEEATRAKSVPPPAAAGYAAPPRRVSEEVLTGETANRSRAVPLAVTADTAPRRNRRAAEEAASDERATLAPTVPGPQVAGAPLVARRLADAASPADEAKRQPRAVNVVPPALPPLTTRRASEQTSVDEAALRHQRPIGAAAQVNTPPLQARRATEETIFETVWRRIRAFLGFAPPPVETGPLVECQALGDVDELTVVLGDVDAPASVVIGDTDVISNIL